MKLEICIRKFIWVKDLLMPFNPKVIVSLVLEEALVMSKKMKQSSGYMSLTILRCSLCVKEHYELRTFVFNLEENYELVSSCLPVVQGRIVQIMH